MMRMKDQLKTLAELVEKVKLAQAKEEFAIQNRSADEWMAAVVELRDVKDALVELVLVVFKDNS